MITMDIDEDLICWTQSFFTNQGFWLVINRHNNKELDIEREILQELSVSSILFLI